MIRVRPTRHYLSIILTALILACLSGQSLHAADCTKLVFNKFCLGGDTSVNIANVTPPPEPELSEDGSQTYSFDDNGKTIILKSSDNITTSITRLETPGGWINYTAWKVKLVRLYRRGTDLSNFPPYATSRSSRLNAINAGRGNAEFEWDLNQFVIKLIWDHPDFIKLQYLLTTTPDTGPNNSEGL